MECAHVYAVVGALQIYCDDDDDVINDSSNNKL